MSSWGIPWIIDEVKEVEVVHCGRSAIFDTFRPFWINRSPRRPPLPLFDNCSTIVDQFSRKIYNFRQIFDHFQHISTIFEQSSPLPIFDNFRSIFDNIQMFFEFRAGSTIFDQPPLFSTNPPPRGALTNVRQISRTKMFGCVREISTTFDNF
jgi:hypothetical protein